MPACKEAGLGSRNAIQETESVEVIMRIRLLLLILILIGSVVSACATDTQRDTLYQVSTLNALMQGLYDGQATVRDLLHHGNFGLGTFSKLDGEMVMLDGKCFQIKSDGSVSQVPLTQTSPFAAVTTFEPDQTLAITTPLSIVELEKRIDAALPTPNWFYAIKITGTFTLVRARSVPMQHLPYPPLVEVVKTQPVFQLETVKGTLVGFRCPAFVSGLNVPGYHLHFLSDDRKSGGHVLDAQMLSGAVGIDATPNFLLALPADPAFAKADLTTDKPADVQKVEK